MVGTHTGKTPRSLAVTVPGTVEAEDCAMRLKVQRGAAGLHFVIAVATALGVYLIGAHIFGAGQPALDAHGTAGFTVHGLELLLFVVAPEGSCNPRVALAFEACRR